MIRNRERGGFALPGENYVASALSRYGPAQRFERANNFAGAKYRNLLLQVTTSTCRVSMVNGSPFSARTSRQSVMASSMFVSASSRVCP